MESALTYPPERDECPPAEALAAFAEASASAELRRRLLPHLARCEECAAVVGETARYLDAGTVRTARRPPWVLPLAAAIPIALGVAWRAMSRSEPPVQTMARTAPSAVPPSAGTPSAQAPAWLTDAPWNSAGRARLGFTPQGAEPRAILLGLHLGALDRACLLAAGPREVAARDVERSLVAGALLDEAEARDEAGRAARGECEPWPGTVAATDIRVELGRHLETWRIAVAEKAAGALDPERARHVLDLVRTVRPQPATVQLAEKLLAAAAARPTRWDEMQADLLDLIEMLCA